MNPGDEVKVLDTTGSWLVLTRRGSTLWAKTAGSVVQLEDADVESLHGWLQAQLAGARS